MSDDAQSTKSPATIYIVDDDEAVRESLSWLISSTGHKAKAFASADHFLESFDSSRQGCVLMDVRMPGMNGMELQQRLAEKPNCLPVIIITGHGDVQMAVRAMKQGAFDFIEKPFNDQVMLDLVQKALDECATRHKSVAKQQSITALLKRLTPREKEVLDLIATGETNKGIARTLEISDKTVEAHRARVMEKLEATSLADLMKKVMAADLGT